MSRLADIRRFYSLMDALHERLGGTSTLRQSNGRLQWPSRGVYFFFEPGERRADSGNGARVVRVGTHALKPASRTSLWHRLSQHAGSRTTGTGNHRGSIFRLLVGESLKARGATTAPQTWGVGSHPAAAAERLGLTAFEVRAGERELEVSVSHYIGNLPFLFVAVEDEPGPASIRGVIERNSIALLSNYRRPALDPASAAWLGRYSGRERVRESGLWNNNHVDETHDPGYLEILERAVSATGPLTEGSTPASQRPVFVFGSNLAGRHGKGAALHARREHGAVHGVGVGRTGDAYAIPIKDAALRTLPLSGITGYVLEFLRYAKAHPDLRFEVTRVGCGLAGYTDAQVAPMFADAPANCELPQGWRLGRPEGDCAKS